MNQFVIFTSQRTGSTSLCRLFNCHPNIQCHYEIFTPSWWKVYSQESWNIHQVQEIKNIKHIRSALEGLMTQYSGFKHLHEVCSADINQAILTAFNLNVIFLWRRNALQQSVSRSAAKQSGILHSWRGGKKKYAEHHFVPMDIEQLKEDMQNYKNANETYRRLLIRNQVKFLEVIYEELFGSDVPLKNKVTLSNNIFEFLGYPRIEDEKTLQQMQRVLDYHDNKLNDKMSYSRIPNIADIRAELENERNGFLFA